MRSRKIDKEIIKYIVPSMWWRKKWKEIQLPRLAG